MWNSLMNPAAPNGLETAARARRCCTLLVGALLVAACAPSQLPDGERRVALKQATEQVILPTYRELEERARELAALLVELHEAPEAADLEATRRAYLEVRAPLGETQAFGFGPATELHSTAVLDQSPLDATRLEAELAGDAELTPSHLRSLGANKRGLHAIEYLLFPADDAALTDALLEISSAGARRRQYASSAGVLVAQGAEELLAAWEPDQGGYGRRFSEPGGPDSISSSVQAGLDVLLNEAVFASEVMANLKLGKPLGSETGGEVDPAAQESERSGSSLADLLANWRGVRNVYLGTRDGSQGTSLSSLVQAKSPSTDQRAREALDSAEAGLLGVPEPLTLALLDHPERVTVAYESIKTLKRVLATEVLGTLGASLKFNDNDGD
jgi:predicted lipoprotein